MYVSIYKFFISKSSELVKLHLILFFVINRNRGGSRRRPRRDEDISGGNGNRAGNNVNMNNNGNNQRGNQSNSNTADNGKTHLNHEMKQPQFDLKASAFPPLPGILKIIFINFMIRY